MQNMTVADIISWLKDKKLDAFIDPIKNINSLATKNVFTSSVVMLELCFNALMLLLEPNDLSHEQVAQLLISMQTVEKLNNQAQSQIFCINMFAASKINEPQVRIQNFIDFSKSITSKENAEHLDCIIELFNKKNLTYTNSLESIIKNDIAKLHKQLKKFAKNNLLNQNIFELIAQFELSSEIFSFVSELHKTHGEQINQDTQMLATLLMQTQDQGAFNYSDVQEQYAVIKKGQINVDNGFVPSHDNPAASVPKASNLMKRTASHTIWGANAQEHGNQGGKSQNTGKPINNSLMREYR